MQKISEHMPKLGDLARMPPGTVAYYEVDSFERMGEVGSYIHRVDGAKAKLSGFSAVPVDTSKDAHRVIRVEILSQGVPRKRPPGRPKSGPPVCACGEPAVAKGFCMKCYQERRRAERKAGAA